MTFDYMVKKLLYDMLLFFSNGQFGLIRENHFFHKQKFKIGYLDLYMQIKLCIIPFWSMSQKLWGVLVGRQLWIPYSEINLEIIYLTQFSISFEKNKIIGF